MKKKIWILGVLTILSICLLPGIHAKYTARGAAADNARVAKFDVSEGGTWNASINAAICPDESIKFNDDAIMIQNNGEVDVKCEITIEKLTDNTPTEIDKVEDKSETSAKTTVTSNDNQYTIEKILEPKDSTNYSLTIRWNTDDRDSKYIGMVDCYKVTVIATQVE